MANRMQEIWLKKARVLQVLKKIPTFAGLQNEEYRALLSVFNVNVLSAGEVIFQEGERGSSLYVVLSGKVDVSTAKTGILYTMSPCEIVGEMAVVSDQPRSATATVVEDAALLEIPRDRLDALVWKAPRVSYVIMANIASGIADKLAHANERLSSLPADK